MFGNVGHPTNCFPEKGHKFEYEDYVSYEFMLFTIEYCQLNCNPR
jgi:hypothetical protein